MTIAFVDVNSIFGWRFTIYGFSDAIPTQRISKTENHIRLFWTEMKVKNVSVSFHLLSYSAENIHETVGGMSTEMGKSIVHSLFLSWEWPLLLFIFCY